MDRGHAAEVAQVRSKLERMDDRYFQQLERLKLTEEETRGGQKNRLQIAKSGLAKMERAMRHLQSGHQQRLKEASSQFGIIQRQFAASAPPLGSDGLDRKQTAKIERRMARLKEARQTVAEKEQQLRAARETNNELRKEIGQMKHNLRYRVRQPRRPDLGILA
jgi:hypothetical protein